MPWLCTGNILAHGCFASVRENINGQAVSAILLAVFAERLQDRNGPYVILRSVTLN